jgi:hypothetical protein
MREGAKVICIALLVRIIMCKSDSINLISDFCWKIEEVEWLF